MLLHSLYVQSFQLHNRFNMSFKGMKFTKPVKSENSEKVKFQVLVHSTNDEKFGTNIPKILYLCIQCYITS